MADLLDSFGKKDIAAFSRDLAGMIKIAAGMEKDYLESSPDLDRFMPRYKAMIKVFNKKYSGLCLKIKKTTEELRLRIFFRDEKSVKDVVMNAARRIAGIKSIGAESLGAADASSAESSQELEKIKGKAQLSYYDPTLGSTTVFLEYDKRMKMVEILYSAEGMTDRLSPEFKLCAFYALSRGYDKKVELPGKEAGFSFNDWSEDAKKRFLDRFDPLLYE